MAINLSELNPKQRDAVLLTEGPVLVIAGAGSGKTKTVAHRIAYLVENGLARPYEILAVTFTNKAAGELKNRVQSLLAESDLPPVLKFGEVEASTFHKFCVRLLRREADRIGITRDFTIYDRADSETVVKNLLKERDIDKGEWTPSRILNAISGAKNEQLTRDDLTHRYPKAHDLIATLWEEYRNRLRRSNALDLDDLLTEAYKLLSSNEEVLRFYRDRLKYLHVDEYQDTNRIQYLLVKLLAGERKNICAVGDDDQAIYGWRGADIRNILEFEKDFPGAKIFRLEQNYRSTPNILRAADSVIQRNRMRKGKTLWTERGEGEKPRFMMAVDAREEAEKVIDWFQFAKKESVNTDSGTAAVLFRTNAQSLAFEQCCMQRGIPYTVVGALEFYKRREVKDVLAYITALAKVEELDTAQTSEPVGLMLRESEIEGSGWIDDLSFERMINNPPRGVGKVSLDKLRLFARERGLRLFDAVQLEEFKSFFGGRYPKGLDVLLTEISRYRKLAESNATDEVVREWLTKCGYFDALKKEEKGDDRIRNVEELLADFKRFREANPDSSITTYLENVKLQSEADTLESQAVVSLLTVHTAKGLEFDQVAVTGLEEGLFPLVDADDSESELEEERRLFYVAITRAKKRLALSCASFRTKFGKTDRTFPSSFLSELPNGEIEGNLFGGYRPTAFPTTNRSMPSAKPSPQAAKVTLPGSTTNTYKSGQKVRHPNFGIGRIVTALPADGGYKVLVEFPSVGPKTILTKYVNLTIEG
ncbi:MAG: UvrD-helicase domain-containing protein [bacterium]|nr:UvrD-helicase domain-containing protein [bacterium]